MKRLVKKAKIEKNIYIGFGFYDAGDWYEASTANLDTLIKNAPHFAKKWILKTIDPQEHHFAFNKDGSLKLKTWQDFLAEIAFEDDGILYHYEWKMIPMAGGNFQHNMTPYRLYPSQRVKDEDNYHGMPNFKLGMEYNDISTPINSPTITLTNVSKGQVFNIENFNPAKDGTKDLNEED